MRACKFTFDDGPVWDGFAHGSTWNGFDNVAVTAAVRDQIAEWMRESAIDAEAVAEEISDLLHIDAMPCGGLYSLGWGYATTIVRAPVRYIVRDVATQGVDFLVWGDDDLEGARVTLQRALIDGLDVELVMMPADDMDDHTKRLIEGKTP